MALRERVGAADPDAPLRGGKRASQRVWAADDAQNASRPRVEPNDTRIAAATAGARKPGRAEARDEPHRGDGQPDRPANAARARIEGEKPPRPAPMSWFDRDPERPLAEEHLSRPAGQRHRERDGRSDTA